MEVTIADIAIPAGVSRMTISRALRNHPEVSSATRDRILSLADSMGYRPNPLVSAWMSGVATGKKPNYAPVLGGLSGYTSEKMRQIMLFRSGVFPLAQKRAEKLGYRLQDHPLFFRGMSPARLSKILATRGCAGVVIAGLQEPLEIPDFDWTPFSVVTIGHSLLSPEFHRVEIDHAMGMVSALESLVALGRRKIGLCLKTVADDRTAHQWTNTYLGHSWRQPKIISLPILCAKEIEKSEFVSWFRKHKPDAIIGANEEIIDWIENVDRRTPPRRCEFVHLDEQHSRDPRTFGVISREVQQVADVSVEIVTSLVRRNERGIPTAPRTTLIRCRFRRLKPLD